MSAVIFRIGWFFLCLVLLSSSIVSAAEPHVTLKLPPSQDNPRNSEGDFIRLEDQSLLYIYTHFTNGAGDHANAHLASRVSRDAGQTWSERDELVIPNEGGFNIMSVSLLRLQDGRIALFYLQKNSLQDCRPVMRISENEAKSWSDPVTVIPDQDAGYYVLNNDRAVQLKSGRLLLPVAQHYGPDRSKWTGAALAACYYSDDAGATWQSSELVPDQKNSEGKPIVIQEPGVVELKDGRLLMFARTNGGSQFFSESQDAGESWTEWRPSPLISPVSPATIERIPSTGDLLAVWNNHRDIDPTLAGKRTPFTAAISQDEGRTWKHLQNIADNPHGWYCYTAMIFVDDHVVLGHCAGDRRNNNGLAESHITRIPLLWLYGSEK